MIDLPPDDLAEVRRILQFYVPECRVLAYGSRVTGRAWKYSDLDLALQGPETLDWRRVERLKDAFAISDLPIMVDVQDWAGIGESFRRIILEQCEELQSPTPRS